MATVLDRTLITEHKRSRGNPNWGVALPYEKVKDIIKPHRFKSLRQYSLWVRDLRSQGKGEGLPIQPYAVYSRKGEWVSKEDFLGQPKPKQPKSYEHPLRTIIKQILGLGKK